MSVDKSKKYTPRPGFPHKPGENKNLGKFLDEGAPNMRPAKIDNSSNVDRPTKKQKGAI